MSELLDKFGELKRKKKFRTVEEITGEEDDDEEEEEEEGEELKKENIENKETEPKKVRIF